MNELLSPTLFLLVALLISLLAFAIWKQDQKRRHWAAWLCSIILLLVWLLSEIWILSPSSDTNMTGLLTKHQLCLTLAWYLTLCSTFLLWLSIQSIAPIIRIVVDTFILLFLVFNFFTIWGMVWMRSLLSNHQTF